MHRTRFERPAHLQPLQEGAGPHRMLIRAIHAHGLGKARSTWPCSHPHATECASMHMLLISWRRARATSAPTQTSCHASYPPHSLIACLTFAPRRPPPVDASRSRGEGEGGLTKQRRHAMSRPELRWWRPHLHRRRSAARSRVAGRAAPRTAPGSHARRSSADLAP